MARAASSALNAAARGAVRVVTAIASFPASIANLFVTSPLEGEVGRRSCPGGGEASLICCTAFVHS
jgi:hypothetical protein